MEEEGDAAVVGVGAGADVDGGVVVARRGDGGIVQKAQDAAAGARATVTGGEPI